MRKLQLASFTFIFTLILSGCIKDNFDAPETSCLDQGTNITDFITIADLKAGYNGQTIDIPAYVKAVVTASDKSGNIYKEFYVQDGTGALAVSVDITNAYTKFPEGRTIYLNLNGMFLLDGDIGYGQDGSFVSRIPALFIDDFVNESRLTPGIALEHYGINELVQKVKKYLSALKFFGLNFVVCAFSGHLADPS
jgi:hypothetical protein